MKAQDLLRCYASGERDFQACNLRGQNFKGQVLCGADFSYADIRGASFAYTQLVKSDFTSAKLGISTACFTGLILSSLLLSGIAGFIWSFTGVWTAYLFKVNIINDFTVVPGIFVSVVLIILSFISIKKGLGSALGFGAGTLAITGTSAVGVAVALSGAGTLAVATAGNGSLAIAGALAGLLAGTLSLAAITVIGNTAYRCLATGLALISAFMLASALGSKAVDAAVHVNWASGGAIFGGIFGTGLSNLLAVRTLSGDERYFFAMKIISNFCSIGGTSFEGADLTNATFQKSHLKSANFTKACLIRINWLDAQKLHFSKIDPGYLSYSEVRRLVVSRNGQSKKFINLDLAGVNLRNADLQDASFVRANLSQSDLRGADLSRAFLKQTQLDGADLTEAILTGACIEDWGITSTTKLENVQCEYVFMRMLTKENPNPLRKPDNWQETFAPGEFADFIQPYFDTLDLYHSQDVDPRAISLAFKKLSQNHPEANLEIVAMEKRGQSSFNLKVRTAPTADKSELSSEYFADYNQLKVLSEARLLLLAEKDDRIHSLEQMIQTALHQPTFTVETVQGDFMPENKGINISAGDNANISGVSSGDGIVNLGTISGSVTNAINQLPDSSEAGQTSLKVLLTQLQKAIETDTDLSVSDKSDLLEQVQSLAEAKQTEEPTKREGIARKTMKMFDATLKSLPDTAKIVEACGKLLPLILKTLGILT